MGNSLLTKNLDRGLVDEVHWLNDREAFEATEALAREQQVFAGNTSGSVYRVLGHVAARAHPGERIVGIFPDRGDRYAGTVYNRDYWTEKGVDALPSRSAPTLIGYGTPTEAWARAEVAVDVPRHLLFVEANTSGTGMLAMRSARELGLVPMLLTGEPARYAGLEQSGCRVLTCDTNSVAGLRAAILDGFRREEIAGLTTTSDFYVPTAARLARWLGLPANPVEAVTLCRDKAELRETLAAAGVRQPRFAVLTDPAGPVDQVGFPCVVKPSDDSGSTNVLLCGDADQARAQTRRIIELRTNVRGLPTARTALVEEFLDGPEFSVEMFGWNGRTECLGITAKQVGELPYFVETGHLFPADLPPRTAATIVDVVRSALVACGMRLGPSHTEVRLTENGPAIIEINPRLAGGMIPELMRLTTGIDLIEQQLRVAAGLPPVLAARPSGHAGIRFLLADREGLLTVVDGVASAERLPGVERVTLTTRPGTPVRPPRHAYDRLGYVIARGASPEEVTQTLDLALKEIRLTVA
ncbi:ATP-grasp domain-containing protein [Salinispora vitiensis]|uniref:ATP-grasp domain-containing protein n=1 Tax=Salinispora vitiensis TaxID=999544 RepID=UPI00036AE36A